MVVMAQQVKNKNKLYLYKIFVDYYNNPFHDQEFNVWAYNENNAINLIAINLHLYSSQLKRIAHLIIYKRSIKTFIYRLFNKVPKCPICTEV